MKLQTLLITALMAVFSCGSEDQSNNGSNNGTNNGQTTMTTQTNQNLEGSTLLVHNMEFTKDPEKKLNGFIEQNMDQDALEFPIVILLDFLKIDMENEMMTLRGGAGLKTDVPGEYIWDPDGNEETDRGDGTISEDGTFHVQLDLFEFIATSKFETSVMKNTIPIRELEIDGVLKMTDIGVPELTKDAAIKGYITKEDGDITRLSLTPGTNGIPLTRIFQEANLNFVVSTKSIVDAGDPSADAWSLEGKISAKNTTVK